MINATTTTTTNENNDNTGQVRRIAAVGLLGDDDEGPGAMVWKLSTPGLGFRV